MSATAFEPPKSGDSRAPCPALNALANHGYLPRNGTNITFGLLLYTIKDVYNLSYPLALLLTFFGFLTCGKISFHHPTHSQSDSISSITYLITSFLPLSFPTWTLDLASLSAHGPTKIAHDASLVHPNFTPSTSPDSCLVSDLLSYAHKCSASRSRDGVSLHDLAHLHAKRVATLRHPLDWLHEHIAQGESGLAWCVMRDRGLSGSSSSEFKDGDPRESIIPLLRLKQWFGHERLPDRWWDDGRPSRTVGLLEAGKCAKTVGALSILD